MIPSRLPPSSGVGQPTIGRPIYGQAKGLLWLTWMSYAGPPQYYIPSEGESPEPASKAKPIPDRTLAAQGRKARRRHQPSPAGRQPFERSEIGLFSSGEARLSGFRRQRRHKKMAPERAPTSPAQRYYIPPEGGALNPSGRRQPVPDRTLAAQGRQARRLPQPSPAGRQPSGIPVSAESPTKAHDLK